MDQLVKELWAEIKALNLKAGDKLPLEQIADKFLKETEYHPDEVVEAFEEMVEMQWLEEKNDSAYMTETGIRAEG